MKRSKAPVDDDDGVEVIDLDVEYVEDDEEDEAFVAGEQPVADDEFDDEDEGEWNDEGLALPKGAQKVFPSRRRPKKSALAQASAEEEEDELFSLGDYGDMQLLPDHEKRPLWITEEGHLFFEMFQGASYYDFIITIAEPIFRPLVIHEYHLTPYSLYGAVSVGLTTDMILTDLRKLCKTEIPKQVEQMIRLCTQSYGKAKLVLHQNRYFIESATDEVLEALLRDPKIGASRIASSILDPFKTITTSAAPTAELKAPVAAAPKLSDDPELDFLQPVVEQAAAEVAEDEEEMQSGAMVEQSLRSFEINPNDVGVVKKRCSELEVPLLEEYDFRNDPRNPRLEMDLKPSATLRPYQRKSLEQMFRNGRARSGMVVLACGAGKTLVGVSAACTIQKSVLVLCTGGVSVDQWRDQFLMWSTLSANQIVTFTSGNKKKLETPAGVVVTTYSMLTHSNKSAEGKRVMDDIQRREWGLLILDEVHVVPANTFRRVIDLIRVHAKLGLTATLVREDELVADLNFLIGPKLYEASWQDLAANGFIAKVQPAEIMCPMTPEFMSEYLRANSRRKDLIAAMNPEKFRTCQFLIQYHEARGDKILVFSDNVFALKEYATALKRPFLFGQHSNSARNEWFQRFRYSPNVMTLFVSKIGDNSIDLPAQMF